MATESFFSNASLAYLASAGAGKDGKTYSIKPTDGSGDFTFSRGSNLAATRVGPTGLIEKGRENLLLQSNNFGTTWANELGDTPILTSGQSGYDGSSDAWLVGKGAEQFKRISQSVSASGVWTYSVYAKANTQDSINLRDQTNALRCEFDLTNGVIVFKTNEIDARMVAVGGGWYRCSVTFNQSTSSLAIYIGWSDFDAGSIYIQDAQLEIGLAATDYIESGATTGKAGLLEDEPRFDYSGGATCPSLLLEPSRTQLVEYTEFLDGSYWTQTRLTTIPNATTSPEGVDNAYKVVTNNGESAGYIYNTDSVTSGTTYTASFFIKEAGRQYTRIFSKITGSFTSAVIDLSTGGITNSTFATLPVAESFGDGWYRVSYTETAGAGGTIPIYIVPGTESNGNGLVGDGSSGVYFWGAQLEEGSYPTSYIPNHSGGSVTRGEDFMSQSSNADNFNDSEGTIFFDGVLLDNAASAVMAGVDAGNMDDRIRFDRFGKKLRFIALKDGSVLFSQSNIMNLTAGTRYKIAARYKANDYALYVNGVSVYTNTSVGTWESGDLVRFAFSEGNDNAPTEANVNQALYFPTGLSNADLETLTT